MARSTVSDGTDDKRDTPRPSSTKSRNLAQRRQKLEIQSRPKPYEPPEEDPDAMTDDPVIANWHQHTTHSWPSETNVASDRKASEATRML